MMKASLGRKSPTSAIILCPTVGTNDESVIPPVCANIIGQGSVCLLYFCTREMKDIDADPLVCDGKRKQPRDTDLLDCSLETGKL